ncbi:hypothetical protein CAPTEDRAFT_217733 [Capitella teleta]|uniref:Uncharacterized protein n=1 Tax=Capitella teleta TaxID=283909 RepID=X2AML2_CAPTE|nr:hypothetical protein CAPTEDRAFT_217733 [Capitella teleta]|eukprot:ELU00344.1 hypothetical protein CAPTEDRAFT_217733 [Capitella teleta]
MLYLTLFLALNWNLVLLDLRLRDFVLNCNLLVFCVKRTAFDYLHCDAFDRNLISPSQRERLQAEYEYIERLKALQKRRDMLPHRESYNFLMGGHKVSLCERFDVMKELNQLKCVVLPSRAKDLYVGRGFSERLPSDHALNHPRVPTKVKTGASNNVRASFSYSAFIVTSTSVAELLPAEASHHPASQNQIPQAFTFPTHANAGSAAQFEIPHAPCAPARCRLLSI